MPNNATPLISVIVPVYNAEDYLRYCIDSILQQSYTNLEVILVDDGAKDSSPAICDEYATQDSRVTVIHQENGGHGEGVNQGIRNATGLYYKVVDSDDWLAPDFTEKLVSAAEAHTADLVIAPFWMVYPENYVEHIRPLGKGAAACAPAQSAPHPGLWLSACRGVHRTGVRKASDPEAEHLLLWQSLQQALPP